MTLIVVARRGFHLPLLTHSANHTYLFDCLAPGKSKPSKKKMKTETAVEPIVAKEWPEIDMKQITVLTREILSRLVSSHLSALLLPES